MTYNTMHRKLYEHVEEAIGLRIIKDEYKPGDTLPNEEALCAEFSVSRGVIREAIKVLQKKGLVRPRPKIGTQIQPRTQWNLFDADVLVWKLKAGQQREFLEKVTEVRRIIESEAANLSAERATTEEIAEIQLLFNRLDNILSDEAKFNYEAYLQADMALHIAILDASHNELLAQIGHTMRHAVQTARQADLHGFDTALASQPLHAAIIKAIVRKDPKSAYTASCEMFNKLWEKMPEK
ncbi:FadR/GntR family transcriptional regulator [Desulfococcaceae bacterium HSG9]|nr:FadR/GntR family transcriptional regulator [Desulfococcaceae bacterium HSG9]